MTVALARSERQESDEAARDRAVLERVAQGDGTAYRELVERHERRLQRLCQGFLGDPEEARDAVQEVFLKAFRKAESYRPRGKVYTWLYRIAVNHCLNQLRRRKIVRFLSLGSLGERDAPEDAGPVFDPQDPQPGPGEQLAARERWRRTREALDGLPESQRAVVLLAKMEGLSQKETARVLGITEGAVESRLFRAMRTLEAAQESDT